MAFFEKLKEQYSELWKAIIRPPRDHYEIKDLGPTVFSIENRTYQRTDLPLKNSRGHNLVCSHFEPIPSERVNERLPVVIYMHGNCSSRLEAISTLPVLLPFNITVFCFDFSGSGLSDGEFISLGYYERDDLAAVVDYLRESNRVTCIGLWGRSMGADVALMHADRDPSIAGLVIDSAFTDLKVICEEMVDLYVTIKLPRWVIGTARAMVRSSVLKNAGFDIDEVAPIESAKNSFIPALFAAAYNDAFINPHHAKELYEAYAGDKNFVMVEGEHNSARSKFFMDSVAIFFFNTLQCDQLPHQRALPARPLAPPQGQERPRSPPSNHANGAGAAERAQGVGSNTAQATGAQALGLRMRPPDRVQFNQTEMLPGNDDEEEEMVKAAIELSLSAAQDAGQL
jgi:pimeloyl-ACP methyl ester carboxylesterase